MESYITTEAIKQLLGVALLVYVFYLAMRS